MKLILLQIKKKKAEIENVIQKTKARLTQISDEGHLRVGRKNGKPQYFQMTQKGDTNGKYLCQKNPDLKALTLRIAQRDYYLKLLKNCESWKKVLEAFLKTVPKENPDEIFIKCPARRSIIKPLVLSDEEYAHKWQNTPFQGKNFDSKENAILTNRKEYVRSKSEKIIADRLDFFGIPYRYEAPVKLMIGEEKRIIYPDFTILNTKTRKEVILEHFGMMDDKDYSESVTRKLNTYLLNGYELGNSLLFTQETLITPLDTRVLDKMISPFRKD